MPRQPVAYYCCMGSSPDRHQTGGPELRARATADSVIARRFLPLACITILLLGCTGVEGQSAGRYGIESSATAASLNGTAWLLSELPGKPLVDGSSSTLQFAAGRASGSDSCNRFEGSYTQRVTALSFGQLASTEMACAPGLMEQASAVAAALAGTRSHRVNAGRLELLGADGQSTAIYQPQSAELAGTEWSASSINNGKGGVASLVAGSTVTLTFGPDGRANGSGGCNRFSASFESARGTLKFGAAAATRMMCTSAGVMDQEQAFFDALGKVAAYRVEADRLELRTAEGALAASFHRVPGGQ
jgi:heat shock protein HslJ